MLTRLEIHDFTIVSHLSIDFARGFSAITGETGAGKSIMLDALGLALGQRGSADFIRPGAEQADLSAEFSLSHNPEARAWLESHDLGDPDQPDLCLLRRTLSADGRSRAYVNGRTTTLQSVRELAQQLIEIHAQHAQQSLLGRDTQRQLLDDYGQHQRLATTVAGHHRELQRLDDALAELEAAAQASAERQQLLRYQLEELDALQPADDEYDELVVQHKRLANADSNAQRLASANALLDDDEVTVSALLAQVLQQLEHIDDSHPALEASREMLRSAQVNCEEALGELRHFADALEPDPEQLQTLDDRLGALHDLARKHRIAPEELPAHHRALAQELDTLAGNEARGDDLRRQRDTARTTLLDAAGKLSRAREQAATRLARAVTSQLKALGMKNARFSVELEPLPDDQCNAHGRERIEFQISTNPGMAAGPLHKIASGGELSRISLAIQVITAATSRTPSLVLDEADVGIGGGTAEVVGRLLRELGTHTQVLAVTHLPQVAAQAHAQQAVEKTERRGHSSLSIRSLDARERVAELARMLGGVEVTAQTQAHAEEMLERAARSA